SCTWAWEMEKELQKEGVKISFEELNLIGDELTSFIYKAEYENEVEYIRCQRTDRYENYFNESPVGVYLIFEED
ncbi:MAG: hypothetical protein ABIH25_04530, partial [Candidatus Woesearchaeota archaeon]